MRESWNIGIEYNTMTTLDFEEQALEDDETIINAMASSCPLQDGKGVYVARALHGLIDNAYFEDVLGCNSISPREEEKDLIELSGFQIFPNPTKSTINIKLVENEGTQRFRIMTLDGDSLKEIDLNDSTLNKNVDISDLINGVYFIQNINEKGKITTKRFVVMK